MRKRLIKKLVKQERPVTKWDKELYPLVIKYPVTFRQVQALGIVLKKRLLIEKACQMIADGFQYHTVMSKAIIGTIADFFA